MMNKFYLLLRHSLLVTCHFLLFTFYFLFFSPLSAQSVSTQSDIYNFLNRISIKYNTPHFSHQNPLNRSDITTILKNYSESVFSKLSVYEKSEFEFWAKEFAINKESLIKKTTLLGYDQFKRFRLFNYIDSSFSMNLSPVTGSVWGARFGSKYSLGFNGFDVYGNIDNFSYEAYYRDYAETGKNLDRLRTFSPDQGFDFDSYKKNKTLNFDRISGGVYYNWSTGSIGFRKMNNVWGTGYNDKIILTTKAPSFPHLYLQVQPTDWIKFTYIHGSLNSTVADSSTYRYSAGTRDHFSLVEKYYVGHIISFLLYDELELSFGESVIYSDKFEPIYLIPVLLFRVTDHYLNYKDENAGNAQMFTSASYKLPVINAQVDASLFIDEFSFSNLFGGDYPSALAYDIGMQFIDPFIQASDLKIEYTRINPFVYFHGDEVQLYSNYGYQLGHWMGSNSDQVFISFRKNILRGLHITADYQYIRRGEREAIDEARYQKDQKFLFGLNSNYSYYSLEVNYQPIHDLYFIARYQFENIKTESSPDVFNSRKQDYFYAGFKYGL